MLKNQKLIIASLLILLPLFDSLFIDPAFGLQYQNQRAMYLLSAYLIPIKLMLVIAGGFTLARHEKSTAQCVQSIKWYNKLYSLILFGIVVIQCAVLLVICTWYVVVGTQAGDYLQQGHISVYTSDVGTLGEATHYFSYQCTDQNGFYTLTPIVTLDWLGHFSFTTKNKRLIIEHNNYTDKGMQSKQIDISMFRCN